MQINPGRNSDESQAKLALESNLIGLDSELAIFDKSASSWTNEEWAELNLKENKPQSYGIDKFYTLTEGSIGLIRHGATPIALVRVIGPYAFNPEPELLFFRHSFPVQVLGKYENYSYIDSIGIKTQGTFEFLRGENTNTFKFIQSWYNMIMKEKEIIQILELIMHKHQIILQGPPGTGKTRLAKDIAYNLITGKNLSMDKDQRDKELKELESSEQYKLIQFHPAYSYEDFVRGIVAKSTGAGIEYKTENKILSQIAEKALTNYKDSKKNSKEIKDQINFELKFEQFIDSVQEKMDSKNREYPINDAAIIFGIENDAFKYYFPNSPKDNVLRMKFSDLKTLYEKLDYIKTRKDIEQFKNSLSSLAYAHRTYYLIILNKFREFITNSELSNFISQDVEQIQERKYILIIDEINRANLPAVLGELIYALEYRDQSVESMYDIDGDRKIVLPKNLYIIGTMNTADRSVGHIDYAIRRRFAFETIFPQRSVINSPEGQILFDKVADLFCKNYDENKKLENERSEFLSSDFLFQDVMIGHSYFMGDKESLKMKLEYEIKPILREYLKDGILLSDAKEFIDGLKC